MPGTQYLALLRGINVGGNNIIKMDALKKAFEEMGFDSVSTYIQSGNVLFRTGNRTSEAVQKRIEKGLSETFRYDARAIVVPHRMLKTVVEKAPPRFGDDPGRFRYDVIFLRNSLKPKQAVKGVTIKEGVDTVWVGKHTVYFSRLIAKASQSRLSRIMSLPVYQDMTIRNWNTTTKLLELMDQREK
jgi:uncharacterized protein (DUF1697 family)